MATKLFGEGGEAGDSLRRLQEFDPDSLVRESELGKKFALREAVEPARRVIDLFKLIRPSQVDFFPNDQRDSIKNQANAFYSLLEEASNFDLQEATPNPADAKQAIITRIEGQFQPIFNTLYPLVSFANIRSLDFSKLERDARASSQAAKDSVDALLKGLADDKKRVETIVGEVRALAAEQGVGKQAVHFKNEADQHKEAAADWRNYTLIAAGVLVSYAIFSLFFHRFSWLVADTPYSAVQMATSKVLIFAVMAYMLFLCSRNFLSHKHNEIVNRHRQNALATFTALAEATSDAASSDIVLSHAAACIFSPQDTGYTKHDGSIQDGVPALQILPRIGQSLTSGH